MLIEVIDFNKKRNGLSYSPDLEMDMFQEEVKEFFDAVDVAERVDAFVDCAYVKVGTICKMVYNGLDPKELPYPESYAFDIMNDVLTRELGQDFQDVLTKAEEIVCEINALKSNNLDENGKVIKKNITRDATAEIRDYIESLKSKEA